MTTTEHTKSWPGASGAPADQIGDPDAPLEQLFREAASGRDLEPIEGGDLPAPIKVALTGLAQMMDFCAGHLAEDPDGLLWFASSCEAWMRAADAAAAEARKRADEQAAAQADRDAELAEKEAQREAAAQERAAAQREREADRGSESEPEPAGGES